MDELVHRVVDRPGFEQSSLRPKLVDDINATLHNGKAVELRFGGDLARLRRARQRIEYVAAKGIFAAPLHTTRRADRLYVWIGPAPSPEESPHA